MTMFDEIENAKNRFLAKLAKELENIPCIAEEFVE